MLGFSALAKQFFGSANERKIKPLLGDRGQDQCPGTPLQGHDR